MAVSEKGSPASDMSSLNHHREAAADEEHHRGSPLL